VTSTPTGIGQADQLPESRRGRGGLEAGDESAVLSWFPLKPLLACLVAEQDGVGIVGGVLLLDLAYEEDVKAETDMNVV
jgi:hypothetical protein